MPPRAGGWRASENSTVETLAMSILAPSSIHFRIDAISSGFRLSLPMGILGAPPSPRILLTIRLLALSPGTKAGPLTPPFSMSAREPSDKPAGAFEPLWQGRHRDTKIGWIVPAKSTDSAEQNEMPNQHKQIARRALFNVLK